MEPNGEPAAHNYLDNIVFKKRNPIIMRSVCLLFGIIVYGCMAIDAWQWTFTASNDAGKKTKRCLYGEGSEGVCSFGIFVSFVALLAAIIFLGGEFVIDKVTLFQYRLQYYFVETIFSGAWTFLFLICFITLETQWARGDEVEESLIEKAGAASSVRMAIWFSFLSIPIWAGSTWMALQRYRVMKAEMEYNFAISGGGRPTTYPQPTVTYNPGAQSYAPPSSSTTGTTASTSVQF